MAKGSGSTRIRKKDSGVDYYARSKEARAEALEVANSYKEKPLRESVTNEITLDLEITKSDIKTILGKNDPKDNKFNYWKNVAAKDILQFINDSKYEGWMPPVDGKHKESLFFAYYSRKSGKKLILCLRKMKDTGRCKPYAIISNKTFNHDIKTRGIIKGIPR